MSMKNGEVKAIVCVKSFTLGRLLSPCLRQKLSSWNLYRPILVKTKSRLFKLMFRSYDNAVTKVKNYGEMGNAIGDDTEEKWITHYSSSHMILLVGEGDFSFSACLARAFGSGANMVATSLDSRESLLRKYPLAKGYLEELKLLGCFICHEVDVAFMSRQPPLKFMCFDRIVFNFPHAGFYFSEHADYQIRLHRDLVTEFLRNAKEMLSENGEIHITHKTKHLYSRWEIVKLAEEVGLYLVRKVRFDLFRYRRYANKRGHGRRCNASFHVGESSTFMFRKLQIVYPRYHLLDS